MVQFIDDDLPANMIGSGKDTAEKSSAANAVLQEVAKKSRKLIGEAIKTLETYNNTSFGHGSYFSLQAKDPERYELLHDHMGFKPGDDQSLKMLRHLKAVRDAFEPERTGMPVTPGRLAKRAKAAKLEIHLYSPDAAKEAHPTGVSKPIYGTSSVPLVNWIRKLSNTRPAVNVRKSELSDPKWHVQKLIQAVTPAAIPVGKNSKDTLKLIEYVMLHGGREPLPGADDQRHSRTQRRSIIPTRGATIGNGAGLDETTVINNSPAAQRRDEALNTNPPPPPYQAEWHPQFNSRPDVQRRLPPRVRGRSGITR